MGRSGELGNKGFWKRLWENKRGNFVWVGMEEEKEGSGKKCSPGGAKGEEIQSAENILSRCKNPPCIVRIPREELKLTIEPPSPPSTPPPPPTPVGREEEVICSAPMALPPMSAEADAEAVQGQLEADKESPVSGEIQGGGGGGGRLPPRDNNNSQTLYFYHLHKPTTHGNSPKISMTRGSTGSSSLSAKQGGSTKQPACSIGIILPG